MNTFFYIASVFLFVMGYGILSDAETIFQQMTGLLILLMATLFLIGGAIITTIYEERKQVEEQAVDKLESRDRFNELRKFRRLKKNNNGSVCGVYNTKLHHFGSLNL